MQEPAAGPVKTPDKKPPRKPLSRRMKLLLGALTAGIGVGGVLWTAATTFPDVYYELEAQTVLRCTAVSQCVPIGGGECWNKPAAALRAVFKLEDPLFALNPGAAAACRCKQGLCGIEFKEPPDYRGEVPPPAGR